MAKKGFPKFRGVGGERCTFLASSYNDNRKKHKINFHTPKLLFHIEEIFSVMQNIEKKY